MDDAITDAELAAEELEDLGFVAGYEGQLCQLCGRPHGGETAYMTAGQLLRRARLWRDEADRLESRAAKLDTTTPK